MKHIIESEQATTCIICGNPAEHKDDETDASYCQPCWLTGTLSINEVEELILERATGEATSSTSPAIDAQHTRYKQTDAGNAELFAALHKLKVAFDHTRKRWLIWRGHWWETDRSGEVLQMAKAVARYRSDQSWGILDLKQRSDEASFAAKSENLPRLHAMLEIAKTIPGISDGGKDLWDQNPWLLGVANGVIDLRTGELRAGRPVDFITRHAPVEASPGAECPEFKRFLERVQPDSVMREYLQRRAGQALTGDVSLQDLAFHYGSGANGKTTLINALADTLGADLVAQAAPGLLVRSPFDRHSTEVADLDGRRLVVSTEVEDGKALAEALVKQLTGGDNVKARHLYSDFYEFRPTWKIWLLANHKPIVKGQDYAIWRRIKLIPWTVTIPVEERDPQLRSKLQAEGAGILSWLIEGCLRWQWEGLEEPEEVTRATEQYKLESNPINEFLTSCCEVGGNYTATGFELWSRYERHCVDDLDGARELGPKEFGAELKRMFESQRTKFGITYKGVKVAETRNEVQLV